MSNDFEGFVNPDEMSTNLTMSDGDNDGMILDLDGVDDTMPEFEALPPGIYPVIVEDATFGDSSAGNPMLTFQFKCLDPQYQNRMFFYHTVLNKPRGIASLKRLLVRIAPEISLANFSPKKFAEDGMVLGFEARVKLRVKPYKGQKRNEVTDVLAPEAAGGDFLSAE